MTIWIDNPMDLLRIAISAPIIYFSIIVFIRMSGKRSTSQMNNFDWIVTVALGSLVGSGIILKDVTVLEALLAIGMLLGMQWVLTKWVFHSDFASGLVKAQPIILASNGELNRAAMRQERVTEREILSAVRDSGLVDLDQVQWIILETDATMNVIPKRDDLPDKPEMLDQIQGFKS